MSASKLYPKKFLNSEKKYFEVSKKLFLKFLNFENFQNLKNFE